MKWILILAVMVVAGPCELPVGSSRPGHERVANPVDLPCRELRRADGSRTCVPY